VAHGWLTVAMAEVYTRAAERKRLALNAHDRLAPTMIGHNKGPALDARTVEEHPMAAPARKVRPTD
jgi:hypothetical protein